MTHTLTITLNPALDVHAHTPVIKTASKLRTEIESYDPGGGGINVSRMLGRLGAQTCALAALGGDDGNRIAELLQRENITVKTVYMPCSTRRNFIIENDEGEHYRFIFHGATMNKDAQKKVCRATEQAMEKGGYVVMSGSLPPKTDTFIVKRLAEISQDNGAKFVLDTSGPALKKLVEDDAPIHLLAPNARELSEMTGEPVTSRKEAASAARALLEKNGIREIAVTLGPDGAVYAGEGFVLGAPAADVPVNGTGGAGDSFLAGLVCGNVRHPDAPDKALSLALAAAGSTVMTEGTALGDAKTVDRLFREGVEIEDMS